MSRVLEANIDDTGKVFVDGVEVTGVEILNAGKQASEGVLFITNGRVIYMATNTTDLVTTLDKLSLAITELTTALTVIDAKPVNGTGSAPAPGAAGNIANLTAIKAELDLLKGALK